jgi:hypothetical protein
MGKTKTTKSYWVLKLNHNHPKIEVSKSDKVKKGDVLAKYRSKKEIELDVASALSIKPKDIDKYLLLAISSEFSKGEVIARKKNKKGEEEYISGVNGKLVGVDKNTGKIKIEAIKNKEILSPVDGIIEEVDDDKIKISFNADVLEGESSGSGKIWGELSVLNQDPYSALNSGFEGKIIMVDNADLMFIAKAQALGVKAVVACRADEKENCLPIFLIKNEQMTPDFEGRTVLLDLAQKRILICSN